MSFCGLRNTTRHLTQPRRHLQQHLRGYAEQDQEYQWLKKFILNGFPDYRSQLPEECKRYWSVREHLTLDDDLIVYGCCLLIPSEMRKEILKCLHESHQGSVQQPPAPTKTPSQPQTDEFTAEEYLDKSKKFTKAKEIFRVFIFLHARRGITPASPPHTHTSVFTACVESCFKRDGGLGCQDFQAGGEQKAALYPHSGKLSIYIYIFIYLFFICLDSACKRCFLANMQVLSQCPSLQGHLASIDKVLQKCLTEAKYFANKNRSGSTWYAYRKYAQNDNADNPH